MAGGTYQVFSAGTEKPVVSPQAIQVMAEIGIDISKQQSKTLEQYLQEPFDEGITVVMTPMKPVLCSQTRNIGGTGAFLIPQKLKVLRMSSYRSIEQCGMRFSRRYKMNCLEYSSG